MPKTHIRVKHLVSAGSSTGDSGSDYTSPGADIEGGSTDLLGMASGSAGTTADKIDFDKWWDIVADYIEDEEDSELAASQIQKINTYISAFRAEVEDASQAMQATIQDAQLATQSSIAKCERDNYS